MSEQLRILAISETVLGANSYSYVNAFRRMGHSVIAVDEADTWARGWRSKPMRALRRLLKPQMARELTGRLVAEIRSLKPDLFFVYKGDLVTPEVVQAAKDAGAVTINYFPDTGYSAHSPHLAKTLPLYDWCFTAKSFGPAEYRAAFGAESCSYLPHCFDPTVHKPEPLSPRDRALYGAETGFVGAWSAKKQGLLDCVAQGLPDLDLKIWGGSAAWGQVAALRGAYQGVGVWAKEYAKACAGAQINLGLLYEGAPESSSGDLTTARTFELAGMGAFCLHERTDELLGLFDEDTEIGCFDGPDELLDKLRFFRARPELCAKLGAAARARALASGYSVEDRIRTVLAKVQELTAQ